MELPVKVEAAIALRMYLMSQENSSVYIEPQIKEIITLELLTTIRETENEDFTNGLQKIVCIFSVQLLPIAVEHLATTFSAVMEDSSDD
jgi:importin-7